MDRERRRHLKALGKAEVARESAAIHASLRRANPAHRGDAQWTDSYRRGTERERWLRRKLPLLRAARLEALFVVHPWGPNTWSPHLGGYLLCKGCGSASPSLLPRRLVYVARCGCGNIRWTMLFGWRRCAVKDWSMLAPVKLIGKG